MIKAIIVGGGAAGMMAAYHAALNGQKNRNLKKGHVKWTKKQTR